MFGQNPIRKPEFGDGSHYYIQEIFPTFQGEGPNTGIPAVFVRLGGCNLACSFCDTEFEDFASIAVEEIVRQVQAFAAADDIHRVVITGGEPFRQPIERLCTDLMGVGLFVDIETNGTIYREVPEGVTIVCSPKAVNGVYYKVREDVLQRLSALKFIVSAHEQGYSDVPDVGQGAYDVPVYVQPMDVYNAQKNAENLALARKLVQDKGYQLSIQTHKLYQVP